MRMLLITTALLLVTSTAVTAQPAAPTARDACGAMPMQGFIGQPKAKLPVNLPKGTRILCDTCGATMDYSANRLNVIYDTDTGIVTQVRCG